MSRRRKISENSSSDISWFDIPFEMREMVTNKMDIRTRCKLLQCSKKCEEEVKISERFLANIKISRSNNPEIHIGLGRSYISHYCLEFIDVSNLSEPQVIVLYKTVRFSQSKDEPGNEKKEIKWMKTENGKAEEIRSKYLREFIGKYSKTIGNIEIYDEKFMESKNCGIKELANLKHFENHFQQLEGSSYSIKMDDLNEEEFEKYLKMLKNGECHRNLNFLRASGKFSPNAVNCKRIAENLDAIDFSSQNFDSCQFRFVPNYEKGFECCFEVFLNSTSFSICIQSQPIID
ncbi:unnamed protein product [Caenorhabditis angaria]|uniref:F-box domain-containing protein n=1 Tax=Caenorhabditis angaria TaxID=860376 RepID=A0A9P1MX26_9PELO|nr:unnamed protein product [Caenorhabditis angaria]